MTFNQWFANKQVRGSAAKSALEAIWNELIGAGHTMGRVTELMNDLIDNFKEARR